MKLPSTNLEEICRDYLHVSDCDFYVLKDVSKLNALKLSGNINDIGKLYTDEQASLELVIVEKSGDKISDVKVKKFSLLDTHFAYNTPRGKFKAKLTLYRDEDDDGEITSADKALDKPQEVEFSTSGESWHNFHSIDPLVWPTREMIVGDSSFEFVLAFPTKLYVQVCYKKGGKFYSLTGDKALFINIPGTYYLTIDPTKDDLKSVLESEGSYKVLKLYVAMSNEVDLNGACKFKRGAVKEYKIKFGKIDDRVKEYVNSYASEVLQHLFKDVSNEKLKDFLMPHELEYTFSEDNKDTHVLLYCLDRDKRYDCVSYSK